jgi:hypothetical protein
MNGWQPTAFLRFVEREVQTDPQRAYAAGGVVVTKRILQQRWECMPHYDYCQQGPNATEWRDVPLESE